jgi:hypothetical protein
LEKYQFDTKGQGWNAHIFEDHNAYAYMYYIFYIQDKKENNCDGLEKYIKEKIDSSSVDFFPMGKALCLPKTLTGEE